MPESITALAEVKKPPPEESEQRKTSRANTPAPEPVPDWFPRLVSEKRLSQVTGIPISTLQTWRRKGKAFPSIKLEGRILYDLHDVKKYLEQQKVSVRNLDGNPYA